MYGQIILDNISENNPLLNYLLKYGCGNYKDEDIFFAAIETDKKNIERHNSPVRTLVSYYTLPQIPIFEPNYKILYYFTKSSSVYDIYKLTNSFVRSSLVNNKNIYFQNLSKKIVDMLPNDYGSVEIKNFRFAKNVCLENHELDFSENNLEIENLYFEGKHEDVINLYHSLDLEKYNFEVFEIAVRSNIRENKLKLPPFLDKIACCMRRMILREDDYVNAKQYLSFVAYTFRALPWFIKLQLFIEREGEFLSRDDIECLDTLTSACIDGDSIRKVALAGDNYISSLYDNFPNYTCVNLEYKLSQNQKVNFNLNVSPINTAMLKIKGQMKLGLYSQVIENLYMVIGNNLDPAVTIEAKRLLIESLMNTGKSWDAIKIFIDESLQSINFASIYDIEAILIESLDEFKDSKAIEYPIVLSVFSRVKSSKYDSELKYSFEVFLLENGFSRPEDTFGKELEFGDTKLHYFLQWVCTPEIMSLYFGFETPEETEECRINVCEYLMRKGVNPESISNELKSINKKIADRIAKQRVDMSRIYVDTSEFTGRNSEQYRILFDRYLQYSKNDYSAASDEQSLEKVYDIITSDNDIPAKNKAAFLSKVILPDSNLNKKNAIFLSLAKLFREEFTYGGKGLNAHLSTRIRHGVLPTCIRKSFMDESLYAIAEGKNYEEIDFPWIHSITKKEKSAFSELLRSLSVSVENIIDQINDEWLQIYIKDLSISDISDLENQPKRIGLFDFSTTPLETFGIQKSLPISPNYEDLVKVMMDWLWEKTDNNLELIRTKIDSEAKTALLKVLDNFQKDVARTITNPTVGSDISNAISRVKSKIPTNIETICSWFVIDSASSESGDSEISTVIDIAKKSLSLEVNLDESVKCIISNESLSSFVDIFHILFENAISKSQISRDDLAIMVFVKEHSEKILLTIINNCDQNAITNDDVKFYQEAYGDENLIKDILQNEGGTGFFKIWKILEKDLGIEHSFFLDAGKELFSVNFEIMSNKHIRKNENINC